MLSYALLISVYHSYLSFRSSSFYLFRQYTANVLHLGRFCEKRPLNHIITDLNRIYHSNRRTHKNNGYCVLLFTPFSVTRFAMHRIYANRINSRGMSRVFCDLRSQKTPRGILPVNSNQKLNLQGLSEYVRMISLNKALKDFQK